MDALSSLKMVAGPQMGDQLSSTLQDATAKTISVKDLQSLNASSDTQALSNVQTGGSFQNLLGNFVGDVNAQQLAANDAVTGLMSGKNVSLHQAMISMEEASVSFQMMVEVRNKLLDSYQELMRMQI